MKVGIFNNVRVGSARFAPFAKNAGADLEFVDFPCRPLRENLHLIGESGCEALIYLNDHKEDEEYFAEMKANGIRYIVTCSAGIEHLNLEAFKKLGIQAANVPRYSPNAVSEHALLLLLALLRHLRTQIIRVEHHDYTISMGRELRSMKVGVIGGGKIGYTIIRALSGFTPEKILVCDPIEHDAVKEYAQYVSMDELCAECDVIFVQTILNDKNFHLIDRQRIQAMKDGVVLINTARGGLLDTEAVLEAVENGKIGALGIDVIEDEGILKGVKGVEECPHPQLRKLLQHENVIFTNHAAYFTDIADRMISEITIDNLAQYQSSGVCERELIP